MNGEHGGAAYVRVALDNAHARIQSARDRNNELNRQAYGLGRIVGAGALLRANAESVLRAAAKAASLDTDAAGITGIDATIKSGIEAGIQKPAKISSGAMHNPHASPAGKLWSSAADLRGTLGAKYFAFRSITEFADPSLRFSERVRNQETGADLPAVIAKISKQPGGELVAVHRIWIAADGSGKAPLANPKMALGKYAGAAVWLGEPGSRLVICEGVENSSSCLKAGQTFAAAAVGGTNIANVTPPDGTREIVVFGDRDQVNGCLDKTGQRALAKALPVWRARGIEVRIALAPAPYKDANDLLQKEGPEAVARCIEAATPVERMGASTSDQPEKPVIVVEPGELHSITEKAMRLLVSSGVKIFQRGNQLVRPVLGKGVDSKGRTIHTAALLEVERTWLRKTLSEHITWFKPDGRVKTGIKQVDAPEEIAKTIISSAGNWPFDTIAGIISTPTLRYDGSILREPGYDARTSLYLESTIVLPHIPETPTKAEAEAALRLLEDLLGEFPFANEASESVALSAMISAVARAMFDVVPAHGARAPTAGTGKSYLFDIVAAILLGERCPVISVSSDGEAETEKRLGAMAMSGQQIIHLDNVNGTLGGDTLCQLIERPTCNLRPLGKSETVRVENRAIIFFNGNNCRVAGDMTRRVILAELDARMERPAEREFAGDPVAMVLADRGKYIAACMTVLRAYIAAGRPKQKGVPMASFGEWSGCVRASLIWLGRADPCETIQTARDEDPELQKLASFIAAARPHANTQGTAKTVQEIARLGKDGGDYEPLYPELHAFVSEFIDRGHEPNPVRLGRWLAKYKGRVVDGLRIQSCRDTHQKKQRWFIETIDTSQPSREEGEQDIFDAGPPNVRGVRGSAGDVPVTRSKLSELDQNITHVTHHANSYGAAETAPADPRTPRNSANSSANCNEPLTSFVSGAPSAPEDENAETWKPNGYANGFMSGKASTANVAEAVI